MNTATLTTMEITVVLYFTLARFRFLYAIVPPTPKARFMNFGQESRFGSFSMSFPRMALMGDILDAFLAEPAAEK